MATRKSTLDPGFIRERNRKASFVRNGGMTPEQRFWSKVLRSDGCWEWQGQRNQRGYGELSIQNRWHKAHRYSWALHNGEIPPGVQVCHRCDNPACVRPDHLFLGTSQANVIDSVQKGRHQSARPKLTPDKVREMRRLAATQSIVAIAKAFDVDYATAYNAIRRKSWRDVD